MRLLTLMYSAGENFGWPYYEGNYPNQLYIGDPHKLGVPQNTIKPKFAWRQTAQVTVKGRKC